MLARRSLLLVPVLFLVACNGFLGSRTALATHREVAPETAAAPAQEPAQHQSGVTRVVFLGDSVTFGQGLASRDEAYPALVAERLAVAGLKIEAVNAGVSGDTTGLGLARLKEVLELKPDVLVVALGGNDATHGQPVTTARENLHRIVNEAQKSGARVLLLGLKLPAYLRLHENGSYDHLWDDLARELDVQFVPNLMDGIFGVHGMVQSDGVHPTAVGQKHIAGTVEPALRDLLYDMQRTAQSVTSRVATR